MLHPEKSGTKRFDELVKCLTLGQNYILQYAEHDRNFRVTV